MELHGLGGGFVWCLALTEDASNTPSCSETWVLLTGQCSEWTGTVGLSSCPLLKHVFCFPFTSAGVCACNGRRPGGVEGAPHP